MIRQFAVLAGLSACLQAQSVLSIAYPTDGMIVHPGETIVVHVSASGPPLSFVNVVGYDPIGSSAGRSNPPYQFSITIPERTVPGLYLLTAMGATGSSHVFSEPVSIDVERADVPKRIAASFQQLELAIGSEIPLGVSGTYDNGSVVDLTKSTQTTYISESPEIAHVTRDGQVKGIAPGATHILVDHAISVEVTVLPPIRIFPPMTHVKAGQTRMFVARITGAGKEHVRWSIEPELGSIDDQGVYTAPATIDFPETVKLTATNVDDPTQTATAKVNLSPASSTSVVLTVSQTQQFKITNVGSGLRWSTNGPGTVDSSGLYTAPSSISAAQQVTITATSVADASHSWTITLQLVPPRPR